MAAKNGSMAAENHSRPPRTHSGYVMFDVISRKNYAQSRKNAAGPSKVHDNAVRTPPRTPGDQSAHLPRAPTGQKHESPGQRPGFGVTDRDLSPERTKHDRHRSRTDGSTTTPRWNTTCRALSGLTRCGRAHPAHACHDPCRTRGRTDRVSRTGRTRSRGTRRPKRAFGDGNRRTASTTPQELTAGSPR
jgi:hypothetical protein